MSWQDWGDVRKKRGTPIKKWPVYEDGAKTASDAGTARKKFDKKKAAKKNKK